MVRLFTLFAIGASAAASIGCGPAIAGKKQQASALRFTMTSLDGKEVDLARYSGKVVMIVNVASKCGFTPQYEALQELHKTYLDQGLAVLGFPCNQFLGQEPGTAEGIKEFCRLNYGVTFDMFAKVEVNGENACELYRLLTSIDTKPKGAGMIDWNFEKFILDRNGFVVARFGSATKPDAPEVVAVIERELAKQAQPAGAEARGTSRPWKPDVYLWKNRVVLAFAPSPKEAAFRSLREAWDARSREVADRDLLLVEVFENGKSRIDGVPLASDSAAKLREEFKIEPGDVVFILIGKDGTEKLRKPALPLDELFATVDAMPMRQQEMKSEPRE
ncbi:MAG: DUF4174 domain-containing protein [Planctomycetota bacterium]